MLKQIEAGVLSVAYAEYGGPDGDPVVLLHGFPYDIHAYDVAAPLLAARGLRVIVPYLRGYGPTRLLDAATPRSGEQAALGGDLLALMDALGLGQALLGGYDWGGRAACIVAALWPERVRGLVSVNGYNIQNIARAGVPAAPENELRLWYQYYFHSERGRAGLQKDRGALCRLLWQLWSPTWAFDDATFERTAIAFDNPDSVWPRAIRGWRQSSAAWRPGRRSPCRRSRSTGRTTASWASAKPPTMPGFSPAAMSTGR